MLGVSVVARPAGWREGRHRRLVMLATLAMLAGAMGLSLSVQASPVGAAHTYDNPILPTIEGGGVVESCADPSVIYDDVTDLWYMYCTSDPLTEADTEFHKIPMFSSADLVNWTYEGDAFDEHGTPGGNFPAYARPNAGLWAPEIRLIDGTWYLFYTVTNVDDATSGEPGCGENPDQGTDFAIGVATSTKGPLGPWVDSGDPVVDPRRGGGGCNFFTTIDPEVFSVGATHYIFFGSYYGGIHARALIDEAEGNPTLWTETSNEPAAQTRITIANRYEGPEVVFRDGYYYLFVSAANCCLGPMTGYSVFAGRSTNPLGPYVDAQGISLLDVQVGGTPVLAMNGNGWVGPGHNTVFQDFQGQWWTIYHAIPMGDPYLQATHINERPAMLDPLDFNGAAGFPTVRSGCWISDGPMPAPAAQPGHPPSGYVPTPCGDVDLNRFELVEELSDEFNGDDLGQQWSWIREPQPTDGNPDPYGVADGTLFFDTQFGDLFEDVDNVGLLVEPSPEGEYVVETRVLLELPKEQDSFWHNFRQAGVLVYGGDEGTAGDDDYVRLMHVSIWDTRQVEFAKERNAAAAEADTGPRFGGHVLGPPADWTFLRIHVTPLENGVELYQAYSSRDANADGVADAWVRGGVWTHDLGSRIGLSSFGAGAVCDVGCSANTGPDETTAFFDWIRVYALPDAPVPSRPPAAPGASPSRAPLPNTASGDGGLGTPFAVLSAALLAVGSATWLVTARPLARRRRP